MVSAFFVYIVVVATASPFLVEPTWAGKVKGRERFRDLASQRTHGRATQAERRKLSGKGKGGKGKGGKGSSSSGSSTTGGLCFSKDMTVQVLGQGLVKMENLQVGDTVLTQNGVYQPVYAFGHRAPNQEAPFLQIFSNNSEPLELTQDHLVYLANKKNPVCAKSVKVGDILLSSHKEAVIHKIEVISKKGIYAPLTLGGNIVVNDILASSYISLQDMTSAHSQDQSTLSNEYIVIQGSKVQIPVMSHHQYVDMALAPYRIMCRTAGGAVCDTTSSTDGMPLYVKQGIAFNRFSSPFWNAHALVILTTIMLSSPFWLVEWALLLNDGFGSMLFLAAACLATAAWIALKKNQVHFVAHKVKTA